MSNPITQSISPHTASTYLQAMAASTRSVKRPFHHDSKYDPTVSQLPTLPAKIQTSLLSVGMRVRKSVKEGYQNTPKHSKVDIEQDDGSIRSNGGSQGLLPYCGILRTGNIQQEYHLQPWEQEDIPALNWDRDGFPSSQESAASISTVASTTSPKGMGKRCYEDEDDDYHHLVLPSPLRSHPPQQSILPYTNALRPMLQPKTRKVSRKPQAKDIQESTPMMDIDDFEEAGFLRFEDCGE